MNAPAEHLRPEEDVTLSNAEFAQIAGVREQDVRELLDYGLIGPGSMDMRTALALRQAERLKADFDLDLFTTGLIAGYLGRINELEAQVQALQAQRHGRTVYTECTFTAVTVRR